MSTLDDLREVAAAVAELEAVIARRNLLIVQARDEGLPWDAISEACGLARQSAYNAYQRGIAIRATRALREATGD
ncbi:hypothetical protein [Actinobaculum sp. 352]|uniref:hypothetical protein n=1 Tax=Actinobaculum sp. 352 TaxID=2490946 RepID=UPI000F7EE656|nr:hypothetical protein [Actinobaculum sp. 352]RTE47905.1 hypothetical protein EKN07_11640 [Actinobaculum sp. 352]